MTSGESSHKTLLPVTALEIDHENGDILAGCGPEVEIYHDNVLIRRVQTFESQSILGISSSKHGVIIWGGRHLAHVSDDFTRVRTCTAPDWILDAKFVKHDTAYAITAHNVLLNLDLVEKSIQVTSLTGPSHGLLMSASLEGCDGDDRRLVIASGSQFGEVIVWSYELESGLSSTYYIINAHEGPVFGVDFRTGLLASCSDDRTVKIWKVSRLSIPIHTTGEDEPLRPVAPIAAGMRHESRVWRVRWLVTGPGPAGRQLLSVGEDATCRLWHLYESNNTLEHVSSYKNHDGKNVWSIAVHADDDVKSHIITGGADGAIVRRRMLPGPSSTRACQLDLQQHLGGGPKDFVRSYDFLDPSNLLLTTDRGHVYVRRQSEASRLDYIGTYEDIARYCIVKSITSHGADLPGHGCFVAGNSGKILFYSDGRECARVVADTGVKVAGLFPQLLDVGKDGAEVVLLATSLAPGGSKLIRFALSNSGCEGLDLLEVLTLDHAGHIITSALFLNGRIFLGSRDGSFGAYSYGRGDPIGAGSWTSVSTEAITALSPVQRYGTMQWLAMTCRDGALRLFAVDMTFQDGRQPLLMHSLLLPFGPNIEGVHIDPHGNGLWVYGFNKTDFIVYDVFRDQEVFIADCGGSHRHWSCQLHGLTDRASFKVAFACTRAGVVYSYLAMAAESEVVKPGGHGREIKACAVRPCSDKFTSTIATGAEDTNIKLWQGGRCVATLRRHVTGIQQLKWSADGSLLFSCGGIGEFFVWRVRDLPLAIIPLGVTFESSCPLSPDLLDLRVMAFDVTGVSESTGERGHLISLGLSNSSIVHYGYRQQQGREPQWDLMSTQLYTAACITQVVHLVSGDHIFPFTAATDGHLVVWNALDSVASTSAQKTANAEEEALVFKNLHQSAITASSLLPIATDRWILATGGDDGGLGITFVVVGDGRPSNVDVHALRVPGAHAAAVSAVTTLRPKTSKSEDVVEVLVVTGSNDQRIKTWSIELDLNGKPLSEIRRVSDQPSPVADVSSMCHLAPAGSVMICGVGMHVCKVDR